MPVTEGAGEWGVSAEQCKDALRVLVPRKLEPHFDLRSLRSHHFTSLVQAAGLSVFRSTRETSEGILPVRQTKACVA